MSIKKAVLFSEPVPMDVNSGGAQGTARFRSVDGLVGADNAESQYGKVD